MLVRYRGINNTGVLDGPWAIWKVLRVISSTLKCHFTENHEFEKIWLSGETEHRRPGVYKVAQCVSAHLCLAKTPSIAIWGQTSHFSIPPYFSRLNKLRKLLERQLIMFAQFRHQRHGQTDRTIFRAS